MVYDLIIIGAGPAGLAAAIYAGRYKMNFLVLSRIAGGLTNEAHIVDNYPGFQNILGMDLVKKFEDHAQKYGAVIKMEEVKKVSKKCKLFKIVTDENTYESKAVIIATGLRNKKINVPGSEKYSGGKGISYCFTCDGPLFEGKTVGIVGGSKSAVKAAIFLSKYAKKIYMIYHHNQLRFDPIDADLIKKTNRVEYKLNAEITKINGKAMMTDIDLSTGENLKLDGLFVEIGYEADTHVFDDLKLKKDKEGYIIAGMDSATNVPGCYAAGDITNTPFRQIICAAGNGAVAAHSVFDYLHTLKD